MRRTALVTGGASGIARAVVEALQQDAWVAAVDGGRLLGAAS